MWQTIFSRMATTIPPILHAFQEVKYNSSPLNPITSVATSTSRVEYSDTIDFQEQVVKYHVASTLLYRIIPFWSSQVTV